MTELKLTQIKWVYGVDSLDCVQIKFYNTLSRTDEPIKKEIRGVLDTQPSCPYCGGPLGEIPHADHIYPISKGGRSTARNMVYVCSHCNKKKKDMTLGLFIRKYKLNRL